MGHTGAGSKALQGTSNAAQSDSSSSSGVLPSSIQGAGTRQTANAPQPGRTLLRAASRIASRTVLLDNESRASAIQRLINEESALVYQLQMEANERVLALQQLSVEAAALRGGSCTGNWGLGLPMLHPFAPSLSSALGAWQQQFVGVLPQPMMQQRFPAGVLDAGLGGFSGRSASLGSSAFEFLETKGGRIQAGLEERFQGRPFKPQQVNPASGLNKRKPEEPAARIGFAGGDGSLNPPPAPSPLLPSLNEHQQKPIFCCALCRVEAASQEGLDEHTRSEMHKKAELALVTKKPKTEHGGNDSSRFFYCSTCNLTTTGELSFKEHCRGKKHKAAQMKADRACPRDERMGSVKVETACPKTEEIVDMKIDLADVKADGDEGAGGGRGELTTSASTTSSEDVLQKGPTSGLDTRTEAIIGCSVDSKRSRVGDTLFFCSLCKRTTISEEQLKEHCRGKKHMAKLLVNAEGTAGPRTETGTKLLVDINGGRGASGSGDGCNSIRTGKRAALAMAEVVCPQDKEMGVVMKANAQGDGVGGVGLTHCASSISREDVLPERPPSIPDTGREGKKATEAIIGCSLDSKGSGIADVMLFCSVCNLTASSEEQLKEHSQGKKHRMKLLRAVTSGGQLGQTSAKPVTGYNINNGDGASGGSGGGNSTTAASSFFCPVCNVIASSQRALENHILGKKHRARAAAVTSDRGVFACNLCSITCTSMEEMVLHVDSANHKATEKVAAAVQAVEPMMKQGQAVVEELKQQLTSNVVGGGCEAAPWI